MGSPLIATGLDWVDGASLSDFEVLVPRQTTTIRITANKIPVAKMVLVFIALGLILVA